MAVVERSIVWSDTRISQEAVVRGAILGRQCHIGRNAHVETPAPSSATRSHDRHRVTAGV